MTARVLAFAVALVSLPASAFARQAPPPTPIGLIWGAELSGAISHDDADAFFNYADYEHSCSPQRRG